MNTKRCRNCSSTEIRKTNSGKYVCNVCLHVTEENVQYSEEFKLINFNFTKKRGVRQVKESLNTISLPDHLKGNNSTI